MVVVEPSLFAGAKLRVVIKKCKWGGGNMLKNNDKIKYSLVCLRNSGKVVNFVTSKCACGVIGSRVRLRI